MTRAEVAVLLGLAATRDYREVGEMDILAWHQDLGDLEFDDAKLAVSRHYRDSTDRLMPAHVRRLVKQIRDERRRAEEQHEVRALPSRYESDLNREMRIKAGMAQMGGVMDEIRKRIEERRCGEEGEKSESDRIRERALARAQGRPVDDDPNKPESPVVRS